MKSDSAVPESGSVALFECLFCPVVCVNLLTILTGTSLQSWFRTTGLCLVGFSLFFILVSLIGNHPQPTTFYSISLSPWDDCELAFELPNSVKMKVLHLTSGPVSGGAAKGALRLHEGLLNVGVESHFACFAGRNDRIKNVINLKTFANCFKGAINYAQNRFYLNRYSRPRHDVFSCGKEFFNLYGGIDFSRFDLIHLHWINYLSA